MRFLIAAVVLFAVLFLARQPLLRTMGRYLVVEDPPANVDAIVVLSGSIPDRILHGVDLYKAGRAPLMFLTREPESPGLKELRARGLNIPEQADLNLTIARQLGVPQSAIAMVEQRTGSTIGEASALLPELRRRQVHSILLVTSKTHARRAALIFHVLDRGTIRVLSSPTPYDPFSPDDWWQHRVIARRVVTEYGKLLFFQLIDRWRPHALAAGGGAP